MKNITTTRTASPRQTFALFCATGRDWRSHNLSFEQASTMIGAVMGLKGNKPAALEVCNRMLQGEQVDITTLPTAPDFAAIYREAHEAGHAAALASNPRPMTVMSGNRVVETVMDGVCGFAWVSVKDGRKPFSKWLVKQGYGRKDGYRGGVSVWVGDYRQSMTRKDAYAGAFASVLQKHGIDCYSMSRMD
jgi:hypothetical protein